MYDEIVESLEKKTLAFLHDSQRQEQAFDKAQIDSRKEGARTLPWRRDNNAAAQHSSHLLFTAF